MAVPQGGLLVVWMNIVAEHWADFDGWYTRQHVPERVGVPGFRHGTRYEAVSAEPRFLAVYETETPAVLGSAPYRERLDQPTDWTQRVMPAFRDTLRSPCRLLGEAGLGIGGYLRTVRIEPAEGRSGQLREALGGKLLAALLERPGVARVRAAEAMAPAGTDVAAPTTESTLRGPDRVVPFVLLLDGTDAAALEAACDELLPDQRIAAMGAQSPAEGGTYRLLYTLSHGSA